MARNTIARIDVAALRHNLRQVRKAAPGSRVMAVVKADAYGHRLDLCLPALAEADMLAVATLEEARAIRRLGSGLPILLLEGFTHASDLPVIAELGLELAIHHQHQIEALKRFNRPMAGRIWLKIDSGMHRLGISAEHAVESHRALQRLPGIDQVNLMTHFALAESPEDPLTHRQLEIFQQATTSLDGERCIANSAAALLDPQTHQDWIRAGISLYGISPLADRTGAELGLKPVMTLQAELIAINQVAAGETIGYGGRYRAPTSMLVGVVGAGYGDGYPRSAADGTPVLVDGCRCVVAGTVSMDMITIDLESCPGARIGDPVELWGAGIPVEQVAHHAGTIAYELVCRITRRVRYRATQG